MAWERNAQIQLVRNDNYWRGRPPFERVIIRHIGDSAAQLLSIRRGDIDIAFNLIPEQISTIKSDANLRLEALTSLDFVYMALTQEPDYNKALAVKEARQAIGYAIDYDGIINSLLGGAAVRPANFLPIGVSGSTEEIAKQIGFRQDLDKAKSLLQKAGLAEGFEFDIAYGNAAIAGVTYQTLAQKIQADLARVNIRAKLTPSGSGQSAHHLYRQQGAGRRVDVLESTGGGEFAAGPRRPWSASPNACTGRCRTMSPDWCTAPPENKTPRSRPNSGSSTRSALSTRPTTSSCSSRSTRSPSVTRWTNCR